jgi:DNA-binding SARP family transcriptional activator
VSDVEVRLLGEVEVLRDGRAVPLPASKKTRALLGYLAVTERPHLRERLCELLWSGPDDPRAALRWSLSKLRSVLDDAATPRLVADRERVAFEPRGARVDLAEVRAALAAGPTAMDTGALCALAGRFRGDLLDGLEMPDAYRFHEWLAGEREAVRALRLRALGTIVDRLAGEPEAALRWARERVAVDPLSESAHVAVIRLLAQMGSRNDALAQFEACARILSTELDAKPGPALLAARMEIGRGGWAAPAPDAKRAARPASRPLVGRAREVAMIDAHLARNDGPAPVLLFAGEPGIGKSRLLDELAQRALARGGRVLRGRAYEAETVRPYGAWVDALRSGALGPLDDGLRADLAPILPELGGAESGGPHVDRGRLFDGVGRLLATLAGRAPLAVLLDDVQWLDDASAALFHATARAPTASRVRFAYAARGEELADNVAALRLVRGLAREGRLSRVDLGPLDAEATSALARALDPGVDASRVVDESAGNPLFAIEVVRALARGRTGAPAPLAESLAGFIDERLARLDDDARDLVPWAAALGRTFGPDVLRRVTGLSPSALASALEELERRGIVRASASDGGDGDGGYDFVHDLIRAGAYRRLSSPRRRLVHMQIARALGGGGLGDGSTAGEVAHHAALGGERELAARAYLAAADRAVRVFASAEAVRSASAGLEHAASLPRDVRLPLQLALMRVKVMTAALQGERRALGSELSRIIVEAEDAGLPALAASGFHTLSILQHDGGDLGAAHTSTLRAVDVARGAPPSDVARQLSDSARCLALLEREIPPAERLLEEAHAILGDEARGTLHFAWGVGLVARFRGRTGEARELIEHAMRLARRDEDHWVECEALITLAEIALEEDDPRTALAWCAELTPVASKMGEGSEAPAAEALESLARLAAGEPCGARLERAIRVLRDVDAKGMLACVLNHAAALDLDARRSASARARAEEALRAARVVDRQTQIAVAHSVLGRVALAEGDLASASRHLDSVRAAALDPRATSARARAAMLDLAEQVTAHHRTGKDTPCPT